MPTALGIVASSKVVAGTPPIPTSGLIGWWDASDNGNYTASGGLVTALADKSGNGRNFVSSGAFRPTLANGTMKAGLTNLDLTSGMRMENQTNGTANQKPFSVFAAIRHVATATYRSHFGTPVTGAMELRISNVHKQSCVKCQVVEIAVSTTAVPANIVNVIGFTYSAVGAWAYYLNSVADGAGTNDQAFNGASSVDYIGDAVGEPYVGSIGEIIKYNRVISGSELTQINSYLTTKWK